MTVDDMKRAVKRGWAHWVAPCWWIDLPSCNGVVCLRTDLPGIPVR